MPQFAYEARTEDGQLVGGMIVAADMEEAGQKLSQSNYFIVKLGAAASNTPQAATYARGASKLKASRRSVMWFINQLSIMTETGIAIGEALDCLARNATDPLMGEILTGVSARVHEGRPLSDSLENYPRTFPPMVTATIRASEASGTLSMVLQRTAAYMVKDEQTVRRLRSSLMYPAFMFLMCVSVTLFLMIVILPKFAGIYSAKGATLPTATRFLLSASDVLMGYGLYLLAAAVAAFFAARWWVRTVPGRVMKDELVLRAPLLGLVLNKFYQSRSFRSMGMLIEAGVSLSEVLDLARNMSTNVRYQKLWATVQEGVTNGDHIASPMSKFPFLAENVVQMIDTGDRAGRLSVVLVRLAEFMEEEYDQAMKTLCQFVEPLMVVFMGGVIGFVAIALLLPMFGASNLMAK